jgi:hypothetical protein
MEWSIQDDMVIVDVISDHYHDKCTDIYHKGLSKLQSISKYNGGNNYGAIYRHICFIKALMRSVKSGTMLNRLPSKYDQFKRNFLNNHVQYLVSVGKM